MSRCKECILNFIFGVEDLNKFEEAATYLAESFFVSRTIPPHPVPPIIFLYFSLIFSTLFKKKRCGVEYTQVSKGYVITFATLTF